VQVRSRVDQAWQLQQRRAGKPNARLSTKEVERHCAIDRASRKLLEAAMLRLSLSARAYHRVLKVARTIADLAGSDAITQTHVAEAVRYRELDRAAD
jgi:magnesium chelatase family protein